MNNFAQTRGNDENNEVFGPKNIDFEEAVLNPSASFGGLYTLKSLPKIDFESLIDLDYLALTKKIFSKIGINIDEKILDEALECYKNFDNPHNPAPLTKIKENLYSQELYHGPTRAFKDMALQPFGIIFSRLADKFDKKYLILTATSGDTGPATLQSFAHQKNISVACIYPDGGTSEVQNLQMTTQNAKNLKILGIQGNFDDAQSTLKSLLQDKEFKKSLKEKDIFLSAANSVNFGRIAFQIIYHISGYLNLVKKGEISFGKNIYIVVPSGNFGNALGAFYAKMMGLPIQKIIIASNQNNILTEFIQTGIYNISNKSLIKTYSPAMDILKSSNIERLLFALFGSKRTYDLMDSLEKTSCYKLTEQETREIQSHFLATFCTDTQCLESIKKCFEINYLLDPHTAIAFKASEELCKDTPTIICSTAQWSKFAPTVLQALSNKHSKDKEAIELLHKNYNIPIPTDIQKLFSKPILHTEVLKKEEVKSNILKWLDKSSCGENK